MADVIPFAPKPAPEPPETILALEIAGEPVLTVHGNKLEIVPEAATIAEAICELLDTVDTLKELHRQMAAGQSTCGCPECAEEAVQGPTKPMPANDNPIYT